MAQDPTKAGPQPPQPPQQQDAPGYTDQMDPKPDHGEQSYKGSGKLTDRAAIITGGSLELVGARKETMPSILAGLAEAGAIIEEMKDGIRVSADGGIKPLSISTAPYPAFPTDMQAQFMAMLTLAEGTSLLTETIFENRYMHVPELSRMGADIEVRGRAAIVRGVEKLHGAPVMATDLRASMSLVLAGLAAEGETQVGRVYHLDRGYERLEEKLQAVGADIERSSDG